MAFIVLTFLRKACFVLIGSIKDDIATAKLFPSNPAKKIN